MPIYEYVCRACGRSFEELTLTAGDEHRTACPSCNGKRVDRQLSAFAVGNGSGSELAAAEPGGCGACGAPRRGMCGE
jgi:putative FmdB family regulatory protein